ncbi:MAG TPA: urease accessory protein UreD [Candidatus Acidoferrales bacterium]|nr:urease accessory protein UreD [Candidatus Acidoferrales bacterium]
MTATGFNTRLSPAAPAAQPQITTRPGLSASLSLSFAADPLSGRTTLAASAAEPPLRVIRAFPREDGSALAHLHNVSGGLLGGDSLRLAVGAAPGSAVQLTTTGATRIYRPRPGSAPAVQTTEIHAAEGALIEYLPDAIIPFAGARFSQQTRIHLAPGSGLFWWEILAPGREARGEIFDYERVEMRAEIFSSGRPVAAEAFAIEPRRRAPASLARLGRFRYAATFYICLASSPPAVPLSATRALPPAGTRSVAALSHAGGLPPAGNLPSVEGLPHSPRLEGPPQAARSAPAHLDPAAWLAAEAHLRREAASLTSPASLWAVSTLPADGLVIRCLAREGQAVLAGLHAIWHAAKLHLFGRPAIPPRKVY